MMMRGDIHYISDGPYVGSEQAPGRPAIIVSNDANNATSATVEVVFLTTRPKHDLPTHVTISSAARLSTALCEQISSVSIERLGNYAGTCTEKEMKAIESALRISLALDDPCVKPTATKTPADPSELSKLQIELKAITAERDMYKAMYDRLINDILNRRA